MSVETPEATRRIERAAETLNRVSAEVGRAVVKPRGGFATLRTMIDAIR